MLTYNQMPDYSLSLDNTSSTSSTLVVSVDHLFFFVLWLSHEEVTYPGWPYLSDPAGRRDG